jgi:hypothetical protein
MAKMTTIRTILAISAKSDWYVHQLDISNTLLHGNLDEDIYIRILPSLNHK